MTRATRGLAATGAAFCALAVALGAYAMHGGLTPHGHERLALAALFLFAHGLALAALAPASVTRWRSIGLCIVLVGTLLFCGSLVLAALAGFEPVLAPLGGSLLIAGWLVVAVGMLSG